MGRRIALGAAIVALIALALVYRLWLVPTREAVDVGAGMLAKQMCSCMFVAGRDQEACRLDQMAVFDPIQIEITDDPKGVRAFVIGLGDRHAEFEEGFGCTLR